MNADTGKIIMVAGIVLLVAGALVYFFHDKMNWIGRLPGDIRIVRDNFRFYFPITTMILLSIVLSFLVWLFKKL
ncbi:MAG: DUF2905 domain-containing protein [Chitinophagaceae bacterium]|nr:DUF2905 domain-containing protein [Chitinophagaceae bacterium]